MRINDCELSITCLATNARTCDDQKNMPTSKEYFTPFEIPCHERLKYGNKKESMKP